MIFVFKKYLGYMLMALSLFFIVAAAMIADGRSVLLAVGVFLLLSFLALFILEARATLLHTKLLYVLYMHLHPREFIDTYRRLLKQKGIRKNLRFSMECNLFKAYLTVNDCTNAFKVLDGLPKYKHKPSAEAIEASNRCLAYLQQGNTENAEKQYALFCKANPGRKLEKTDRILKIRLALAKGEVSEKDILFVRNEIAVNGSALYRAEMKYLLACMHKMRREDFVANSFYKEVSEIDSELYIVAKSKEFIGK